MIYIKLPAFKRLAVDFREVWARMRSANGLILLLALGVYYTTFFFRSYRWQVLLANVGFSRAAGYAMPSTAGLATAGSRSARPGWGWCYPRLPCSSPARRLQRAS